MEYSGEPLIDLTSESAKLGIELLDSIVLFGQHSVQLRRERKEVSLSRQRTAVLRLGCSTALKGRRTS